jgi:uncharacterized membrane protein
VTHVLPRYLFAVLCGLVALASLRVLLLPFDLVMAHMVHYLPDWAVAAYVHMICGPMALAVLPLQTSAGLRARRPGLHRAMGRVAAASMIASGVAALVLMLEFQGSGFAAAGFFTMAVLWIGFTVVAVQAARARDFARHRAFMLRAAALTFGAVTLRIIMAPLMAMGWTVVETYDVTAWGCWLPSLLLVEWWMLRQSKRAPVGAL